MTKDKNCEVCEATFTPKTSDQIYCTPECREVARKKKDKLYRRNDSKWGTEHKTKKCEICLEAFIQKSKLQRVCSEECRTEKNRRYQREYQKRYHKGGENNGK